MIHFLNLHIIIRIFRKAFFVINRIYGIVTSKTPWKSREGVYQRNSKFQFWPPMNQIEARKTQLLWDYEGTNPSTKTEKSNKKSVNFQYVLSFPLRIEDYQKRKMMFGEKLLKFQ